MKLRSSLRIGLILAAVSHALGSSAQTTALDLRQDGRILVGSRLSFLVAEATLFPKNRALGTGSPAIAGLSNAIVERLASSGDLRAIVVPQIKSGSSYKIGVLTGAETLPLDLDVSESDFQWLRRFATSLTLARIEIQTRKVERATSAAPPFQAEFEVAELRKILTASDDVAAKLYAGFALAEYDDSRVKKPYADVVAFYRASAEKTALAYLSTTRPEAYQAGPIQFTKARADSRFLTMEEFASKVEMTPERFVVKQATATSPAVGNFWNGRTLIVVPSKDGSMAKLKRTDDVVMYFQTEQFKSKDFLRSSDLVVKP